MLVFGIMCVPCTVSFIDWFWDLVNTQGHWSEVWQPPIQTGMLIRQLFGQYLLATYDVSIWLNKTGQVRMCYETGAHGCLSGGGGTDLERGYGDVRPWRPPFHASPAARKGPISSKRVGSQDPLLRKFGNFSLNSLNFHPNFSSQALSPKF